MFRAFTTIACLILSGIATQAAALAGERPTHERKFSGKASYYSHGQKTASGVAFDPTQLTAAHRTLPFGTRIRVTNPKTGKTVIVTVNDRGPFVGKRVIDVSLAAARLLGMVERGVMDIVAEIATAPVPVGAVAASEPLRADGPAYD
jgi:rare lipoprotein A (peptidoglycan hydrolase)